MIYHLILIIIFSVILAFSTNFLLEAMKKLSKTTGIGDYALANFFLALGTSLPELLIGVQAALNNETSLALGNVIGSNIANLSVVIGGATIIGGGLVIEKNILKNDIYYTFLIAAAPLILLFDGKLDRLEGIVLLIIFLFWQAVSLRNGRKKTKRGVLVHPQKNLNHRLNNLSVTIVKLIIGIAGLMIASHQLVKSAGFLVAQFKISPLIIGIFIVGLGSSLPELVVQTKAIRKKQAAVALGDLLGSVIANSSLILGITAIIRSITLAQPRIYLTTTLFFLLTFSLFYIFIKSKAKLERWEGAILLMLYFVLVALELT